ncbi:hypothetical protein FGIG_02794 [Fasciola gigantica]|uniref:Transmembrane protein 256 n=1 Tax=Fasciola gigantica TaxID=46835 RepID=A0A504WSS5_FASGI|nr:hypothetical protein FGIG_02794 [Fasciola gigantica]
MVSVFVYDKNELASDVLTRLAKSSSSINVLSSAEANTYRQMPRGLIRIIGLLGAASLAAGAYGAHGLARSNSKFRRMFQMGAHYQLLHSIVLLGVPFVSYPCLTTLLFLSGNLLFSGSCYYMALCGQENALRFSTLGGVTLLLAWLSMAL